MPFSPRKNSPAAIWNRLLRPAKKGMPRAAARFFLKLAFSAKDLHRMHELTAKNQAGQLTDQERNELQDYRRIGLALDLLKAQARAAMNTVHSR